MKKQVEYTVTAAVIRQPQTEYKNKHGLLLREKRQVCHCCGDVTVSWSIKDPNSDLSVKLSESEFRHLEAGDFEHWDLDFMYFRWEQGANSFRRSDLRFWTEELDTEDDYEKVAFVTYVGNEVIIDLYMDVDRFLSIQDILNYSIYDFHKDFSSGEYQYDIISKKSRNDV
ncbi:MAG TPA: hypothetical protein VGN63_07785 [Flavisolibacter sp.]|jgi:hypothetical protein|nr:hypothetical protein [Flavisolibacter sp.]